MGGYAEDALLAGAVTRPHEDIDLIFPRDEEKLRRAQLAELGFTDWETWGEAAPGVPFYLFGQSGDLKLDLGVIDEVDGENWMRVHRLSFTVGGREAPAGTGSGSRTISSTIHRSSSRASGSSPFHRLRCTRCARVSRSETRSALCRSGTSRPWPN
jgi:hypothetical protein